MGDKNQRTATGSILTRHAKAGKINVEDIPNYWRNEVKDRLKEMEEEEEKSSEDDK